MIPCWSSAVLAQYSRVAESFGMLGTTSARCHHRGLNSHDCRKRTPDRNVRVRAAVAIERSPEATDVWSKLQQELQDIDRGIFGVQAAKKAAIHSLIEQLEDMNPLSSPTEHLDQVDGKWILQYSTISIMGTKRSKLGLREFVRIEDMCQTIDTATSTAVNTVEFSVTGFGLVKGELRITAEYKPVDERRVDVVFQESVLEPQQLQKLFQKNYDLLLSIFNPEGWLDITYVDESLRVGRDSKGNVFLLQRSND